MVLPLGAGSPVDAAPPSPSELRPRAPLRPIASQRLAADGPKRLHPCPGASCGVVLLGLLLAAIIVVPFVTDLWSQMTPEGNPASFYMLLPFLAFAVQLHAPFCLRCNPTNPVSPVSLLARH